MYRIAQWSVLNDKVSISGKKRFSGKNESGAETPLSSFLFSGLPPVAFDEDPTIAPLLPAMGNPDRAGMRGADPMAMGPNVAMAVPAVIAVDPHPAFMRRRAIAFDDGRGRRHASHNSHLR
jgi:hypothetical protein